jgi:hypothetical protein
MRSIAELLRLSHKKKSCGSGCLSTAYWSDKYGRCLCVVCDNELFEPCYECLNLAGWCSCGGATGPAPVDGPIPSSRVSILRYLEDHREGRRCDIVAAARKDGSTVDEVLGRLVREGVISRTCHGIYQLVV